jgi:pimeloyl-ACP methyl ester carboxylesterase
MSKTVVFVHGAWVTPACWDAFKGYFASRGYTCVAPAWPHKDRPIEELRQSPPAALAGMGVAEIVDHYERIVRSLAEPPLLVGHSFGGLFVQLLLDRGLGRAGVAIDSAPPRGVVPLQWSAFKSNAPVLFALGGWKRILHLSFEGFSYAFVHTLPLADRRAAYERHVVPETGRIFFQAGLALADPRSPVRVNFQNGQRAPLLLIAGGNDHIVPAASNRANHEKYRGSAAVTDFKEFPGRTHWIIAQDGWEEVAGYAADWAEGATRRAA